MIHPVFQAAEVPDGLNQIGIASRSTAFETIDKAFLDFLLLILHVPGGIEILAVETDEAIADAVVDAINLSGQQYQQKQKQTALNIFFHLIIYIISFI